MASRDWQRPSLPIFYAGPVFLQIPDNWSWKTGKISAWKMLSSPGTGCPGQWWRHHSWRDSRHIDVVLEDSVVALAVLGQQSEDELGSLFHLKDSVWMQEPLMLELPHP